MAYLPFGDGPRFEDLFDKVQSREEIFMFRNCVGMRFALLEAKIAVAKALRVVEVQCCERTEVPINLGKLKSLTPKQGIWIRVVRRS